MFPDLILEATGRTGLGVVERCFVGSGGVVKTREAKSCRPRYPLLSQPEGEQPCGEKKCHGGGGGSLLVNLRYPSLEHISSNKKNKINRCTPKPYKSRKCLIHLFSLAVAANGYPETPSGFGSSPKAVNCSAGLGALHLPGFQSKKRSNKPSSLAKVLANPP